MIATLALIPPSLKAAQNAQTVTVAVFARDFDMLDPCQKIAWFAADVESKKGKSRFPNLEKQFDGCVGHSIPYGGYVVKGSTDRLYFEGTCAVESQRPVCLIDARGVSQWRSGAEFQVVGLPQTPAWLIARGLYTDWHHIESVSPDGHAIIPTGLGPMTVAVVSEGTWLGAVAIPTPIGRWRIILHSDCRCATVEHVN